ncbi:HNH endonuclease [Arthrobacter sp. StoSoilB19]|uniref:HNH endonuclease signature motif containing protein n=1 Tax=Arthrobacter sp. StoSoilB19 TaxID=2830994 RepID=UPI001CC3B748|nr:HNH endonuclease signature motif containing protein [Arthrobacter sp. StoSoilB19]BCW53491.1 HNH endonuclease [Arthrobacter sp. StoSoilB19]
MEAIGEQLDESFGGLFGGNADDAGSRRTSPARLRAVPGGEGSGPDILGALAEELATAALAAPGVLATATYIEAADYAARVENLARTVEYLQLISALTVDRTRTQAITQAAARTTAARRPLAPPSPADDGCRNTAEFLRLRLRIPIREARRRLTLAQHTLPRTSLTGQPLPPTRPHLATALTPHPATDGTTTQPPTGSLQAPAVSSHAATLINSTLDRLQHHTTPHTLYRIEKHLTTAATTTDPDFLTRLAQRWTDTIDADGTEPTEEALRHTQGAFIRKPRHGLHHLEIFATTDQYEHLLTVMNTATNPRTTTPNTSTGTGTEHHGRTAETAAVPDLPAQPAPPDLPDLDRRTRAQKQLDGIITATKTALATNTLPTTGGNKPQIIATIHYRDLFPTHTTATATGERPGIPAPPGTQTGTGTGKGAFAFTGPVAATTLRKIACDADIIPALLGTNGEILDLGRKTRLFTPAQRTALTTRDQGCAFPNCTIPAPWCEAHHITYWSHGGPTTTNNGVLLCSHHHHLIHKEQWTITTTNHTPTFIPPPHLDPTQKPQQNHYFKPPPPPHQYE